MRTIRQTVLETLGQRGPLNVQELARATHLSIMATRYHLGLLARERLIAPEEIVHCGRVGRPQIVYTLTDEAHARLPQQYEWLAAQLIAEIAQALGGKETRALLRRAGRRIAGGMHAAAPGGAIQTRLRRTAKLLSARGYMARVDNATETAGALVVCNCPFRSVASEHRELCELDRALVIALLDAPAQMTRCLANADDQCRFDVVVQ